MTARRKETASGGRGVGGAAAATCTAGFAEGRFPSRDPATRRHDGGWFDGASSALGQVPLCYHDARKGKAVATVREQLALIANKDAGTVEVEAAAAWVLRQLAGVDGEIAEYARR